jgi:hypothetical protein
MWWLQRWQQLCSRVLPEARAASDATAADAITLLEIEDKLAIPFGLKHDLGVVGMKRELRLALEAVTVRAFARCL